MNIQLDLTNKIIKLAENVSLKELVEVLDKLLPGEWKDFKLETNTIINNWSNPTIIYRDHYWPYQYPWNQPSITWTTTSSQGTYNLSIN